jgi:hypothetical protein
MSKQTLGGIHNVLNGLLSPVQRPFASPEAERPKPVEKCPAEMAKQNAPETPPKTVGARRGRPLGHSTPVEPKSKVTLWINQALVESYRDWSWEARCQFSHLVERALADYHRRERKQHFTE